MGKLGSATMDTINTRTTSALKIYSATYVQNAWNHSVSNSNARHTIPTDQTYHFNGSRALQNNREQEQVRKVTNSSQPKVLHNLQKAFEYIAIWFKLGPSTSQYWVNSAVVQFHTRHIASCCIQLTTTDQFEELRQHLLHIRSTQTAKVWSFHW